MFHALAPISSPFSDDHEQIFLLSILFLSFPRSSFFSASILLICRSWSLIPRYIYFLFVSLNCSLSLLFGNTLFSISHFIFTNRTRLHTTSNVIHEETWLHVLFPIPFNFTMIVELFRGL